VLLRGMNGPCEWDGEPALPATYVSLSGLHVPSLTDRQSIRRRRKKYATCNESDFLLKKLNFWKCAYIFTFLIFPPF